MADSTIKVVLEQATKQLTTHYEAAKAQGVTKKVEGSERDFEAHLKAYQKLIQIIKPSQKDINDMIHEIEALGKVVKDLGKATSPISKATEEVIEKETELAKARDKAVQKAEKAEAQLSKKKSGELGLKNKIIADAISGITHETGSSKGKGFTVDTFTKFALAGDWNKFGSQAGAAQTIWKNLQAQESQAKTQLTEANTEIAKYDKQLTELKAQKVIVNPGDKMVIDANEIVANVKSAAADARRNRNAPSSGQVESGEALSGKDFKNAKEPSGFGKLAKQFTIYAIAMRAAKSAIREAVGTIKELDKSLTEQAMVTGKTRKETYELVGQYQELAKATASTTKEVAQVATEYMKQGKSTKEALVLTEAAISAAKVARVSVGDSVNYLTTALNGFRLSADQAMAVSDKFAAVAASSATDYDELAIALSKVASQANLAGMSIDYTTALLTKGLETTREAPETMGTALKTVIARMREIKDYGETLQGDTDINNVESQLAVVGIALRDQQGELRSTQDVLDELGKKWDTLNKNQQAAIAKALAGTRQQSRLIAMMDGYERVTELQQISERSAGATMAQMGTHLEGMEAALNRVQVAWEEVVTNLTDSDVIIGIINQVSIIIDHIANLLADPAGMIAAITAISLISMNMLGTKLKEHQLAQLQYKQSLAQQRLDLDRDKASRQQAVFDEKVQKNKIVLEKKETLEDEKQVLAEWKKAGANDIAIKAQEQRVAQCEKELKVAEDTAFKRELSNDNEFQQLTLQDSLLKQQESTVGNLLGGFTGIGFALVHVFNGIKKLATGINGVLALKKQGIKLSEIATMKNRQEALTEAAGSVAANKFWGWAVALTLLAAAGVAAGVAIAGMNGAFDHDDEKEAAKEINDMSNEIYKLNEKANALNEVGRKFDDIDKKVIKTSKDMQDMNSLLDSAADKLSEEEKAKFKTLGSPEAKAKYLKEVEIKTRDKARAEQLKQVDKIKEHPELLTSDDPEAIKVQAAVKAAANAQLYDEIDSRTDLTREEAIATEHLTHAILDQLDAKQALQYADSPEKMKTLVNATQAHAKVLEDESKSLKERTQAYLDMKAELSGSPELLKAFEESYSQWAFFAEKMNDQALDFIDNMHLSNDAVNELFASADILNKKLSLAAKDGAIATKVNTEEYQSALIKVFGDLDSDFSNFEQVLSTHFANIVNTTDKNGAEWNALVETIGDKFGTSILDMGQKMAKFKNTISSFYETASKWSEMSEDKKSEFISENAELFEGPEGDKLLEALNTNNYEAMEKALNNEKMRERRDKLLEEINRNLAIEMAKGENEQNKAYIQRLTEQKKFLEDTNNLYKVSIKTRLEQQEKQLSHYKEMLQKEHDAVVKSLEKRKDAYQKYFDSLKENREAEDYEEQAELLVTNIAKLGSDSTGTAQVQREELQNQLATLEKERLETLRERAQEEVINNLDKQVEEINEKFDTLIESNQALLIAMQNDLKTDEGKSEFLGNLLINKAEAGATKVEMENYLKELQPVFGSKFAGSWDKLNIEERNGNLFLNVSGQEILLNTDDQQSVYTAIMEALRAIGQR